MQRLQIAAFLSIAVTCCYGYRFFQDRIPNGDIVPHPCREGETWQGVGHLNEQGGGERNPFGLDFHANGKKWDRTICLKDSDGDGLTNGEELGDPKCVWKVGDQPERKIELSHPGVCDPWNSPECKDKTTWVSCESPRLKCPAMHEPGTTNITVRLPVTPVPAKETTYKCYVYDYPVDQDYHMVANEPYIDNINIMHHILIYGCNEETDNPVGTLYDCNMEVDSRCKNVIGIWSFGMNGECAHRDMGFRIGKRGYTRGIMQFHWNNPELRSDYTDSSGVIFHLTTNLRPNDGGILAVGQEYLVIPPGEERFKVTGVCSSECSKNIIKKEVKIPVAFNHMHGLGFSQKVEHIRDGERLPDITYDPKYDYNSPELHIYESPLTLKSGDELRTECVFKSTSRTRTTFFGDGTAEEMCYGFITYYPKENIPVPYCTAWKDVTKCAFNVSDVIKGCRFKHLHDLSHPDTKKTYDLVMDNCSPHIGCRKECKPVVKQLKQTSCYNKGTVDDWARMNIETESTEVMKMMKFYSALDSCDIELAVEAAEAAAAQKKCPPAEKKMTNGASGIAVAGLTLVASVVLCLLL